MADAVTMTYVFNINPYVEAKAAYECDKVLVTLTDVDADPVSYQVKVDRADTYGAAIDDGLLLSKDFSDRDTAVAYYNAMILQLQQGDVIRNI